MRKADNLPPSYAVVTKSGNLNFLQPSGTVQSCNGTALPFTDVNSGRNNPVGVPTRVRGGGAEVRNTEGR